MTPTKAKRAAKLRTKPVKPLPIADTQLELPSEIAPRLREVAQKHVGMSPLDVMLKVMHELVDAAEQVGATSAGHAGDLFGDGLGGIGGMGGLSGMSESRIKLLNMAAAVGRHVAPYVHPRLSAIEHTGKDGAPLQSGVLLVPSLMDIDEWEKVALAKPKA
jgi:hypothetical protein